MYKNKFGSNLIVGGSGRYPGAALLCSMSSNISGTGHTAVSTESSIAQKIIEKSPEITLFASLFDNEDHLKKFSSISLGVGLSQNKTSIQIFKEFRCLCGFNCFCMCSLCGNKTVNSINNMKTIFSISAYHFRG